MARVLSLDDIRFNRYAYRVTAAPLSLGVRCVLQAIVRRKKGWRPGGAPGGAGWPAQLPGLH
jgi:hypothetical protein